MSKIQRAILSVTDKSGLVDFAHKLIAFGVELVSTGGTAKLLRESGTAEAAELLGRMEPDEAADGLRELEPDEQKKLLAAMPAEARDRVATLLGYGERTAGGIMTTVLVVATPAETIAQVRDRLRANREHDEDLAGVIVLGDDGQLLDDVTMLAVQAGPGSALLS